jgi:hypothetical protein
MKQTQKRKNSVVNKWALNWAHFYLGASVFNKIKQIILCLPLIIVSSVDMVVYYFTDYRHWQRELKYANKDLALTKFADVLAELQILGVDYKQQMLFWQVIYNRRISTLFDGSFKS